MLKTKKTICTSCMACYAACPVEAINIITDEKGFYAPVVDEKKCIHCGVCNSICPMLLKKKTLVQNNKRQKVYACTNSDEQVRVQSSSGGLFSAFANYVLENNGHVCGAVLNDDLVLRHVVSNNFEDIEKMRGSKYIQSYIGNCWNEIKKLLNEDKQVLFCGTPCQCAGLKSFLRDDYKKLITIDLLCTCVNPPVMLKEYLNYQTQGNVSKYLNINFRDKINGWGGNPRAAFSFSAKWLDKEGCMRKFYEHVEENLFFKGFLEHLWMKDSCNSCIFMDNNRVSDLTLGDFWCINEFDSSLNDNKGLSFVMVNSAKGDDIFEKIKNKLNICKEVDFNWAVNTQSTVNGVGMKKHKNTDLFFKYESKHYSKMELTKDLLGINKVGVMTFDFSVNFGAQLQAWAFCEKIKELGFSPKIIHWSEHHLYTLGDEKDTMKPFRDKYFSRSQVCYTQEEILSQTSDCNKIIIGGDQVFRVWNSSKDSSIYRYLGDFVSGEKLLASYGSSFGFDFFNANETVKEECKKLFQRFDKLAVREKDGVKILKETFGVDAREVLDPVFLFDKQKYNELIQNEHLKQIEENYIAYMYLHDSYGLGEVNKNLMEKFKNEKVINININETGKYNLPQVWLNYIKNAKFVITDSFHCVAFCVIFKKPFVVIERDWGGNSRIDNILEKFNLQNLKRKSLADVKLEDVDILIDWESVYNILDNERQYSENYLLDLLLTKPKYKDKYEIEAIREYRISNELIYKNKKKELLFENLNFRIEESYSRIDCVNQNIENIKLLLKKDVIFKKYYKYKILSKITFGGMRKRYKNKRILLKEQVRKIRSIAEDL